MSLSRKSSDGPWCWQSKAALRAIREGFEAESGVASGLAVYLALTEVASDRQSDTFQVSHAHLAGLTGLCIRTIQNRLNGLSEMKLIHVSTPELRTASTYTLLPFGNGCVTPSNGCRAFGNEPERGNLPAIQEVEEVEESEKNLPEAENGSPFEALAELEGWTPATKLTKSAGAKVGAALKEIEAIDPNITGTEIRARIVRYRREFPNAAVTAPAIAKHWQRLKPAPAPVPLLDGFIS